MNFASNHENNIAPDAVSADTQSTPDRGHASESKIANSQKTTNSSVALILGSQFDVMEAVGGIRGIVEAVLPTLAFLLGFMLLSDHLIPAFIALAVCVVFIFVRLLQRIAITPALGGLLAMGISVFLAWRSGEASDIFLWGILLNAVYFFVLAISVLVKWPIIGVFISLLQNDGMGWRSQNNSSLRRCYYQITWIWVGVFALRLLVQLPLYFARATQILGFAKLILGLPLFALALWFSWLIYHAARKAEVNFGAAAKEAAPAAANDQ
ncbi:hypothetical protein J2S36_000395 [Arcanobacterium hippocoleae]|uniref:DUF3159 domain-containing protein n=1 Tax=Arcanobacterium hippocoleae TaxID=149017 RepID=A0ABU1T0E6_9ACTO|nr:hypothetical protein [Arcanobacterium hippocoleae]